MKANKKTLMAVKQFLESQEGWDIDELKERIIYETDLLKSQYKEHTLATDECGIVWGDGYDVCNLSDFVDSYTNIFIEKICNVLDSFVGEDISLYFNEQ